jgi:hypothetical protein
MIFVLFVASAMAALTWLIGWWGVLLAALIIGYVFRAEGGGGWRVALAAAEAWGALLLIDIVSGPFGTLSHRLGGVMKLPPIVLILVTLAFPGMVAWSAATVVALVIPQERAQRTT